MKKILTALLVLGLLTGCQKESKEKEETFIYTYIDHTPGIIKQYPMAALNYDLKAFEDLKEKADLMMVAKVTEIKDAKYEDERFKTPHTVEIVETMKGEPISTIDMDGGRMTLMLYKTLGIDGKLPQSFIADMSEKDLKAQVISMMPAHFYDLEVGKTYLFFIKDGEILNEGYGVYEKVNDDYINVITSETLSKNDIEK